MSELSKDELFRRHDGFEYPSLQRILEIGKLALAESHPNRALQVSVDQAINICSAEHGMVLLFDAGGEIFFQTARNLNGEDIINPHLEVHPAVVKKVSREGKLICIDNALSKQTSDNCGKLANLDVLSVVCSPFLSNGKVFGMIYFDNRSRRAAFGPETLRFVYHFCDFISLAASQVLKVRHTPEPIGLSEEQLRNDFDFEPIVGHSPQLLEVLQIVSQVAGTEAPVLIEGETGTGKELVARAIHFNSKRRNMPLVSVNCGAFPENLLESEFFGHEKGAFTGAYRRHRGKFEQADGGTIFLDEIDEMSLTLQVKLLRIFQWGEFSPLGSEETKRSDVRIVAASKKELSQLVNRGEFRDDLYYRLNLIRVELPPLRERKKDILLLAINFLHTFCVDLGKPIPVMDHNVQNVILNYDYPGNVRELENIIRRAAILCTEDHIEIKHFPPEIAQERNPISPSDSFQGAKKRVVEEFERRYIERILEECSGVVRKAAKRAGMHEKNFHEKLKRYGIH